MLFAAPIDNSIRKSNLTYLHELMYQIDTIEVDDSYLQLGFTHREKDFVNLKSSKTFMVNRDQFKQPDVENDPIYMFIFSFSTIGKNYERTVYNSNDMLGNVGGIYGILQALAGIIAYYFTTTNIDTEYISIFKDPEYQASTAEKAQIDEEIGRIRKLSFQARLWIHKVMCCENLVCKKILFGSKQSSRSLEYFDEC